MALNVIPNSLSNLRKGEERTVNKIRLLYAEIKRECYLYVKPRLRNLEPDFILIDPSKGICIIEVKDWDLKFIKEITRTSVKSTTGNTFHNPAFRANQYFNLAKGLFESDYRLLNENGTPIFNLFSKVIFTQMSVSDVSRISDTIMQYPTKCISSNQIRNLSINELFDNESCVINANQLSILRSILFPEIKIEDSEFINGNNKISNGKNYKTIKALDGEQEQFAKRIPDGHYMVSGVPGSGKTVILLSRAIYLLREHPEWKIIIVTYNRSLVHKIENRLNSLEKDLTFCGVNKDNISISTFHRLALDTASIGVPQNATDDFWRYELPAKALAKAKPIFDALLIDEYQDFYNDWIKFCIKLTKTINVGGKQTQNIFLAGDRLQSIYNPNEHSWISIGIDIQGRSKLLKHTYRAGKSHIAKALQLLLSDKKLKKEVKKFYDGKEGIENQSNISDEMDFIKGDYDKISEKLHELIFRVGYKPEEILILTPNWEDANFLFSSLSLDLQDKCKVTKDVIDNKVIITTYHSSKGLENRICILVNIEKINDLKLIYVGMTRASHNLYLHSQDFNKSAIAQKLKEDSLKEAEDDEIIFSDELPF